jgi:four helix bundle protein
MDKEELKSRTKKFALRIIKLFRALPKNDESRIIGKQLLRCGTSVGANYRAVCRARSMSDFVAKLGIVIEEADESCFWLEIIIEAGVMKLNLVNDLLREANEITAIMVASSNSAGKHKSKI